MVLKLILILATTIALVFLWTQWWFFPSEWEQQLQAYMQYRKLVRTFHRDMKRTLKQVFGAVPKQTRKGIRVGKRLYTQEEFVIYAKKCLADKEGTTND